MLFGTKHSPAAKQRISDGVTRAYRLRKYGDGCTGTEFRVSAGAYDPASNITHHPTPNMRRFGVNQFNEPLFRIVWSESVRHLIGGTWPNGEIGYHWSRTYKFQPGAWVLEQWTMPSDTLAQWNSRRDPISGFPLLGPYPNRGYYEQAFVFDQGVSNDSLDNVVATVRHKQTRSFQDDRDLVAQQNDYEDRATKNDVFEEFKDAVQFRPTAALSYGRHGRGTKTEPNLISAEEAGMPIPKSRVRNPRDLRGLDVTSNFSAGR
jgi:hypothetical protein